MALQASRARKLDAEADEMIKAQAQTVKQEEAEPEVAEPEVAATSVEDSTVEQTTEVKTEQPAGDVQPAAVTVDEAAALRAQLAKSEQRYRSLQGMFDKSRDELDALRQMVKQLTEAQPKPEEKKAPKFVTEKDEEAYGSDMIDLIRRAAREIVESEFGTLDGKFAEVDKRVQQVGEVVHRSAADRFADDLTKSVPDWQEINLDPAFAEWLGKYGLQALNTAYSSMDVSGTAKFFNDYKKLHAPAEPAPVAAAPAKNLESLQAPGKAKATAQVQAPKGKIWTKAEISKLDADYRRGKITAERYAELDADLTKAYLEGRVAA